jgi:hypothetical protein
VKTKYLKTTGLLFIKAVRLLYKFFRSFDISPIDAGGLSKPVIYLIWGLNFTAFIGADLLAENDYNPTTDYKCCSVCTFEKKISPFDLYTESIELVNDNCFIVISSYDYEVPQFDVLIVHRGRSPPSLI